MKRLTVKKHTNTVAVLTFGLCTALVSAPFNQLGVQAEEAFGYYDEYGNWISDEDSGYDDFSEDNTTDITVASGDTELSSESLTGTYTVGAGWSVDDYAGTSEKTVYKQDALLGTENTSTITCSYLDTNYSVFEYEQLRDMLMNNLIYSDVNAQISASAVYTKAKDYLYILTADDSAKDYRDLYYYVVGDYRCFCVEVREYRAEAEQAKALDQKTPQEMGQSVSEEFTWNTSW